MNKLLIFECYTRGRGLFKIANIYRNDPNSHFLNQGGFFMIHDGRAFPYVEGIWILPHKINEFYSEDKTAIKIGDGW